MTHRDLGFKYSFGAGDEEEEFLPQGIADESSERPGGAAFEAAGLPRPQGKDASRQAERILTYIAGLLNDTPVTSGTLNDQHLNREKGSYAGVPAGYTYLYQFAAHDMTHSLLEARPLDDASNPQTDLRREPLALETLFGGGPMGCRHAYDMRNEHGAYPLRLAQFRDQDEPGKRKPPSRDLPRVFFSQTGDVSQNSDGKPDHKVSDVLIADPRNDDNNLLAQMTVLFSRLYNVLVKNTETDDKIPVRNRALLARIATVRIYRRILRADLMGRLMQDDVREAYTRDKRPILREPADPPVSREFRFAASRLAHSMVRPKYFLNAPDQQDSTDPVELERILDMSSLHVWGKLPTPRDWMIDWEFFFKFTDKPVPRDQFNWALRFGPTIAIAMTLRKAGEPLKNGYPKGVPIRDFFRANLGEIESVRSLVRRAWDNGARFNGFESIVDDGDRRAMVEDALALLEAKRTGSTTSIQNDDRRVLVSNPPLLLYLMFEAQMLGDGHTYGPLGSILVGDAFLPVFEDAVHTTKMARDAASLEASVFGEGKEIDTMPDLITNLDSVANSIS